MSLDGRIVREAADAIIAADLSGKITLWNGAAERLFGYSAAEALAQSLDLIIPEAQRKRHWDGYRHVMQTGETRYGTSVLRVPAVRKDGTRISVALRWGLGTRVDGSGIFAILRDDTERWKRRRRSAAVAAREQAAVGSVMI
jgi:PAS domain S-box-containing protein